MVWLKQPIAAEMAEETEGQPEFLPGEPAEGGQARKEAGA